MSEFKDFSLPELYQTPSPQEPGQINWKSVAVYGGIAILSALTIAIIINQGNKVHTVEMKELQKQYSADIAKKNEQIEMLISQVLSNKHEHQTAPPNESQS